MLNAQRSPTRPVYLTKGFSDCAAWRSARTWELSGLFPCSPSPSRVWSLPREQQHQPWCSARCGLGAPWAAGAGREAAGASQQAAHGCGPPCSCHSLSFLSSLAPRTTGGCGFCFAPAASASALIPTSPTLSPKATQQDHEEDPTRTRCRCAMARLSTSNGAETWGGGDPDPSHSTPCEDTRGSSWDSGVIFHFHFALGAKRLFILRSFKH